MPKKILICGGEGYIGSYVTPLLRKTYDVVSLDLQWFGGYPDVKANYGDLLRGFVRDFDVIIVLAGYSSVGMCTNLSNTFKNNVIYFEHLLEQVGDQKLIFASSGSVSNGHVKALECSDSHPAINPYDASKQMIETLAKLSGKNTYGLRFGTVCGVAPNQRMDLAIPRMIHSAITEGKINLFNSESLRSFLSLPDLFKGLVGVIEGPDEPDNYNLASFSLKMGDVAEDISEKFNIKPPKRDFNVGFYSFSLDCFRMKAVFGVEFTSTLEDIINEFSEDYLRSLGDIKEYERCI